MRRQDHILFILSALFTILSFIWLKYKYPLPNFLPDSYSYMEAAFRNQSINMWPIGYSMFLRIVSCFVRGSTALIFIQYMLLQAAILYFLLTIRSLLSPGKWTFYFLLTICMANPLTLQLANFISSDALFAALSLIWITQIIRIIHHPSTRLFWYHACILLLAFMIRYNALYYPFISAGVILVSRLPLRQRLIGISGLVLFIGAFIIHNAQQYQKITGTPQFSAFSGWQLATNGLYAYSHVNPSPDEKVPPPFLELHRITRHHMDSLRKLSVRPDQKLGTYYLWDEKAPLKLYQEERWKKDTVTEGFAMWAAMGPLYGSYGKWLIGQHPLAWLRYYIWPNLCNYYSPPAEFLATYNMGKDSVDDLAVLWFHLTDPYTRTPERQIRMTGIYPTALAIINPLFMLALFCFWFSRGHKRIPRLMSVSLQWVTAIWFANLLFSVLASPIVLRYQVFPMILTVTFLCILVEHIYRDLKLSGQIPREGINLPPSPQGHTSAGAF